MPQETLRTALWNTANVLRSKMDASEYKNYVLGVIFYKFLSDKLLVHVADLLEQRTDHLDEAQQIYEEAFEDEATSDLLTQELINTYFYTIRPELTYTKLMTNIRENTFQLDELQQAFQDIERTSSLFENLFSDVDLYSKKLGSTPKKQNDTISEVMKQLSELNFAEYSGDALGDAYEYMLSNFASESGKKAGEFYTPQSVSTLMAKIVILGKENKRGFSAYDPTMGSGSLLLNMAKYSDEPQSIQYFGQEINHTTYNLARMNMLLHGVYPENQTLNNGDTLDEDWPVDEPTNYDAVVMNPPYSQQWSSLDGFLEDPRFSSFGVIPPKSKADYAFLLHGFYHLKNDGVMAIVLPHGVLFRGSREETLRKKLLERGMIEAIIGLPEKIFYNTGIPTTIIVLRKNKEHRDVFFIDASNDYEKVGKQNHLTPAHIDKIIATYRTKETIDKYSYLATYEDIEENDFNLNIPRYVDTFEPEPEISLNDVSSELIDTTKALKSSEEALFDMLNQLHGTDEASDNDLKHFINALQELGE